MPSIDKPLARFEAQWTLLFRRLSRAIHRKVFSCSSPNSDDQCQKLKLGHPIPTKFIAAEGASNAEAARESRSSSVEADPDLLALKIGLLGDCDIGKTSFAVSNKSHNSF